MLPVVDLHILKYDTNNNLEYKLLLKDSLLDSGASKNFINKRVLPECFKTNKKLNVYTITNAVSENVAKVTEDITVNVKIEGREYLSVSFDLIDGLHYPAILGFEFLKKYNVNFGKEKPMFLNSLSNSTSPTEVREINLSPLSTTGACLKLKKSVFIEPSSSKWVKIDLVLSGKQLKEDQSSAGEMLFSTPENLMVFGLEIEEKFKVGWRQILLLNRSSEFRQLQSGTVVGIEIPELNEASKKVQFLNALIKNDQLSKLEQDIILSEVKAWKDMRDILVNKVDIITEVQAVLEKIEFSVQARFREMLKKYEWYFSRSSADAGLNQMYSVSLTTEEGTNPVYAAQYKVDQSAYNEVSALLGDLRESLILEHNISNWNAPAIFIKKPNGSYRLVNNFSHGKSKSLNSSLIPVKFPLSTIRTIMSTVSNAISSLRASFPEDRIVFSSLDCKNAYFTLRIISEDRDKTAFSFNNEQFTYSRMSQGLSTSPGTFCYFITSILKNLEGNGKIFTIIPYMDDFLISHPAKKLPEVMDIVLKRLTSHGLIIGLSKCSFSAQEVKFLGYQISENTIQPDPAKIKALIDNFEYPVSLKAAQRMMGRFNYYSRALRDLSVNLRPLSNEIAKGKAYKLNDEIKSGLDNIKKEIQNGVTLNHLKFYDGTDDNYIYVAADTSGTATGGVIGNCRYKNDEVSRITICGYSSRELDKIEKLLSSRCRELIGLTQALKSFSDLLPKDRPILLFVDHKSLTTLTDMPTSDKYRHSRTKLAYAILLEFSQAKICYLCNSHDLIKVVEALRRPEKMEVQELDREFYNPKTVFEKGGELNALEIQQARNVVDFNVIKKDQDGDPTVSELKNVRTCLICSIRNPERFPMRKPSEFRSILPTLKPYAQLYIDCIDVTTEGKTAVFLTATDGFSLKLFAERIQSKSVEHMAPALMLLCTELGICSRGSLTSDNGSEFVNNVIEKVYEKLNIHHTRTSCYNSSANRAERSQRDLRQLLRQQTFTFSQTNYTVRMAVALLNSRPKKALDMLSPNEVLFGVSPPVLFDNLGIDPEPISPRVDQYMEIMASLHASLGFKKMSEFVIKDEPAEQVKFKVNDLVLAKDTSAQLGHRRKNLGPLLIIKEGQYGSYGIRHLITGNISSRNQRHLIKLKLSEEDEKLLRSKSLFIENGYLRNNQIQTSDAKIALSPLAPPVTEKNDELPTHKYNLRRK